MQGWERAICTLLKVLQIMIKNYIKNNLFVELYFRYFHLFLLFLCFAGVKFPMIFCAKKVEKNFFTSAASKKVEALVARATCSGASHSSVNNRILLIIVIFPSILVM